MTPLQGALARAEEGLHKEALKYRLLSDACDENTDVMGVKERGRNIEVMNNMSRETHREDAEEAEIPYCQWSHLFADGLGQTIIGKNLSEIDTSISNKSSSVFKQHQGDDRQRLIRNRLKKDLIRILIDDLRSFGCDHNCKED